MTDTRLRIGDADRERAAATLGEHYAQGRLTADEHAERLDQVWAARTRGDLVPVFRDLPDPSRPRPVRRRGLWSGGVGPFRRGLPTPFAAIVAFLLVVTVLTHLPFLLLGVLLWAFVATRHRRWHTLR